jgi:hypothetical protein
MTYETSNTGGLPYAPTPSYAPGSDDSAKQFAAGWQQFEQSGFGQSGLEKMLTEPSTDQFVPLDEQPTTPISAIKHARLNLLK